MSWIGKYYNSLAKYYSLIIDLFEVDISQFILDEFSNLENSFYIGLLSIFSSVIFSGIIIYLCKNSIEGMTNRKNKFLDRLMEIK